MAREKTETEKGKKKGKGKKPDKKRKGNRSSRYMDSGRLELNKLKRILQFNGGEAALAWAQASGKVTTAMLKSLRTLKPSAFQRAVDSSTAFAKAVGASK